MADFLSRLAARTLGVAPTARPSIASMYAPEPARGRNYAFDSVLDAELVDDSASYPFAAVPQARTTLSPPPSFVAQDNATPSSPVSRSLRSHNNAGAIPEESPDVPDVNTYSDISYTPLVRAKTVQTSHDLSKPDAPGTYQLTVSHDETALFTGPAFMPTSHPGFPATIPVSHSRERQMHQNMVQSGSRATKTLREPSVEAADVSRMQVSDRSSGHHKGLTNNVEILQSGNLVPEKTSIVVDARPPGALSQLAAPSYPGIPEVHPSIANSQRPSTIQSEQSVETRFAAQSHEYTEFLEPIPTIQVTIGRIEVRATPPPPAQPQSQQRPAPPVMSLDQYLQQRSKGGDR